MFYSFLLQRLDGTEGLLAFELHAIGLVDVGNFIGDVRRLLGGFQLGVAEDVDFDEAGVAGLSHINFPFQDAEGLKSLQRKAVVVAFSPLLIQFQILDDFVQDFFGSDFLKFSLDKKGIDGLRRILLEPQRRDVRNVLLHRNTHGAGPRFRKDQSHGRSGQHHEQKHGHDDRLANADDAPVIEEMEFGLRRTVCFWCFHEQKKEARAFLFQPPVCVVC